MAVALCSILVTGGIATGKSTFCDVFQRFMGQSVRFFDADACVHQLLTREDVVERVTASLGTHLQASDGSLDRRQLGALVFQDTENRRVLEGIIHPLVRQACHQARAEAEEAPHLRFFVADIPLFYETGFPFPSDLQLVVACGPRTQRARLAARHPHWDIPHLDSRLSAQLPILDKVQRATQVLWNGGTRDSFSQQITHYISWLNQKFPPPS
jgi:dephospho-CoA kinase